MVKPTNNKLATLVVINFIILEVDIKYWDMRWK
jgi:hypothetical protein